MRPGQSDGPTEFRYEAEPPRSYRPSPSAIIALVAAIVGFGCTISTTTRQSFGGVGNCTYLDFGPLLFAILATAAAVVTLTGATRPPRRPVVEVGIGVLALAVAGIHALRAFGMIGGAC